VRGVEGGDDRADGSGGHAAGDRFGRVLERVARGFALAGGVMLLAVTALTVTTVVGRSVFNRPVLGDFELVEIGVAVAVFAFFPYCQLCRGNVVVDFFTRRTGARARAWADAAHSLIYALIAALFAWRLALGGAELRAWGETSMILGVPIWWGFVPIAASMAVLAVVCVYTLLRSLGEARR
jgi:TRAP-type C4-dicarboxylate transport system permease small subunit